MVDLSFTKFFIQRIINIWNSPIVGNFKGLTSTKALILWRAICATSTSLISQGPHETFYKHGLINWTLPYFSFISQTSSSSSFYSFPSPLSSFPITYISLHHHSFSLLFLLFIFSLKFSTSCLFFSSSPFSFPSFVSSTVSSSFSFSFFSYSFET